MSSNQILTTKDGHQNVVSVLFNNGPTQAGVMVGIVNAISQPFSQSSVLNALNLNAWTESLPLLIAIAVSFMLAIYQTLVMQKTSLSESLIVIPLVTGILFGMSLGANHLTADVINSSTVTFERPQNDPTAQQRRELQQQLDELQKQLALLDQPSSYTSTSHSPQKTRGHLASIGLKGKSSENYKSHEKPADNPRMSIGKTSTDTTRIKQKIEKLRKKMEALNRKTDNKTRLYRAW